MFQPILLLVCGLGQTPAANPPQSFYTFCESLMRAETNLGLDHSEIENSKNPRRARAAVVSDLKDEKKLVGSFETSDFAAAPENADFAQRLRGRLDTFITNLDALQTLVAGHDGSREDYDEKSAWGSHGKRFRDVLGACWKLPGFSIGAINPAVYYNTFPRLHDGGEAIVLADAQAPNEAKVWKTFGTDKPKLKRGDLVVAYWLPEDKKWIDVGSWGDLEKISDFAVEDTDQKINLRVQRRGKTLEMTLDFVPVLQDSD